MDAGLIVLFLVLAVVVFVLIWAVSMYNRLVRLRNHVQEAWRQIDVELHRRYDLIPNLIETVKGYAAHERAVFDEVTRARAAAATPGSTPGQQAQQEDILSNAIGRLFAVAEAYPQLRAAENFVQLQNELTNTEDRIAAGRRFYNANVRSMNTKVEVFPSNIIANVFNFVRAEYFEVNDQAIRSAPSVSFNDASGNVGNYQQQSRPAPAPDNAGPSHGGQPGGFQPGQGGGQPGYPQPGQGGGQPGYPQPGQGGGQPGYPQPGQGGGQPGYPQPGQGGGQPDYAPQQGQPPQQGGYPQHGQQSQAPQPGQGQPPQGQPPQPGDGGYPQSPPPGPGQG